MSIFDKLMAFFQNKNPDKIAQQEAVIMQKPTTKYTTKMVNSVSFSSDMKTLYLIDDGRAIAFSIDDKRGVFIGTLKGQITVVTGIGPKGTADESPSGDDPGMIASAAAAAPAVGKTVKLSVKGNQYTTFYNTENQFLAIIGATDIDISISAPEEVKCEHFIFDIKNKVLKVRRIGNALEIQELDK
ncbi:MAG: hypothetical protein DHS20C18_08860 [Saprospiraceae bacterium]|nr:MAG: hypothetical protein DHS20C18_08860 [Saprospiraceae bacterium]